MSRENIQYLFLLSFVALYMAVIAFGIITGNKRRKTHWPFKDSDKLLRGPGETLRRRILALDERAIFEIIGFVLALTGTWAAVAFVSQVIGLPKGTTFTAIVVALSVVTIFAALRLIQLLRRRSRHYLGWYGERIVADYLRQLEPRGYRIFHDVPAEPGAKGFNLDHVAVGPTGVVVIEVKSRRKGAARPGYKDHEVIFNGTQLDWPAGYDRKSVDQALNEADWLEQEIQRRTTLRVPVRAVLAIPGWYVRESPNPKLRVVNAKVLPDAIHGRGNVVLLSDQIDLIACQLDLMCRDVED